MKVPKFLAAGLIAAGLVIGGSTTAHAVTASPYVTVLWSYDGYPDLTKPQPFVSSYAGADLHAFDATLAQADSCGHAFQIDVYKVEVNGVSWETLRGPGDALQYAHDGGFLAYDAGVGTPYRVITPEEYPCQPSPTPTSSPTPSGPSPSASVTPQPSSSPSATAVPVPTSSPTTSPTATPSPTPSVTSSPTASPSPSAVASSTPSPSSSPTATATPSAPASVVSSTPNGPQARELAYTGVNPWPGVGAASVLVAAGIALQIVRRVRRG